MNLEALRDFCLKKKGKITEEFPFGNETLVYKIFGKIFILISMDEVPLKINLKCHPERAVELRERYAEIQPGYHMNKNMWNTVTLNGNLSDTFIYSLIDHSFDEVLKKVPVKKSSGVQ